MIEHKKHQNNYANQMFVLADDRQYNLKQTFQKILGFSAMYNNTCVVLAIKSHCVECVSHIAQDGKIIKQHRFKNSDLNSYAVISDRQVMWVDTERSLIVQWHLQTNQLLQFPYKFVDQSISDIHELFIFPSNNLVCIAESGNLKSKILKLTYYKYPLNAQSQPVHTYENENIWNYQQIMKRANTQGMLVWYKSSHQKQIQFSTYQVKQRNGSYVGAYKLHSIQNSIRFGDQNNYPQIFISNMWQMSPHKYMFVTLTNIPIKDGQYPNAIFVYEQNSRTFRQANFALQGKYRLQNVDCYSFGNTALIKTFDTVDNVSVDSPVYYISNELQTIIAKQTWKCSYLYKYSFPGYDQNLICEGKFQNGKVSHIGMRSIKVVPIKELVVNMVIQLVANNKYKGKQNTKDIDSQQTDEDLLQMISAMVQIG